MRLPYPPIRRTSIWRSRSSPILGLSVGLLGALLGCRDGTESPVGPAYAPAASVSAATALSFRQVSVGVEHTCGVTTDNRAYCWGVDIGTRRSPIPPARSQSPADSASGR